MRLLTVVDIVVCRCHGGGRRDFFRHSALPAVVLFDFGHHVHAMKEASARRSWVSLVSLFLPWCLV
jgi:hypothetical protein